MKTKRAGILGLVFLLLFFCASAGAQGPINRKILNNTAKSLKNMPDIARERTDSIVIGVSDLFGETNPFWVQTTGDHYIASMMFDELLFASNNGDTGPGVASYAVSSGGNTYTFTIRDKVAYTDGQPVLSDDFINAFYLLLMPGFTGSYDITKAGIAGVDAYLRGDASSIDGIRRIDDRSFSITMENANPENLFYLAVPALRVHSCGDMRRPETLQNPDQFAHFYRESLQAAHRADATQMAYGQYIVAELSEGESATLTANNAYWRGAPFISEVIVKVLPTGNELDAIMNGSVDIVNIMGSVEAIDTAYNYESAYINLYTWDGDVVGYLGMDLENAMFSDLRVRKALACGLNRDEARKESVERYGYVPGMLLFDSFSENCDMLGELYPYDPEQAAQLLEDAGWQLGEDGIRRLGQAEFRFSFYYNSPNPIMDRIISRLQADFLALGIEMTPKPVSFEELLTLVDQNACAMYFMARKLPISPALSANLFSGSSHLNTIAYHSDRLDRIAQWASMEEDAERQTVIYENLYQELYVDLPFIPLYRRSELILINARVMNATITSAHDITADIYRFFLVDSLEGQW